jgi:hypothetical protein
MTRVDISDEVWELIEQGRPVTILGRLYHPAGPDCVLKQATPPASAKGHYRTNAESENR